MAKLFRPWTVSAPSKINQICKNQPLRDLSLITQICDNGPLTSQMCDNTTSTSQICDNATLAGQICETVPIISQIYENRQAQICEKATSTSQICDNATLASQICENRQEKAHICENGPNTTQICDNVTLTSQICENIPILSQISDGSKTQICESGPKTTQICDNGPFRNQIYENVICENGPNTQDSTVSSTSHRIPPCCETAAMLLLHEAQIEHHLRHRKQRPKKFRCPHCQVAFSNNGQLRGHVRIHTGQSFYSKHWKHWFILRDTRTEFCWILKFLYQLCIGLPYVLIFPDMSSFSRVILASGRNF